MRKKQNLVSVLLSIYNVDDYLEECLDSILCQSYKNLEVVCVNNGSPDRCGEILKKYAKKDERIKIVTLKENKMLCGGRNAGLDNATGDYICFVDPDDWIEKDYIKSMVEAIEKQKDPDGNLYNLVINYAAKNFSSIDGHVIEQYDYATGNYSVEEGNKNPLFEANIPAWGRLYRKKFLDDVKEHFTEGFQTDNIPYMYKLLANLKYEYVISRNTHKNSEYWRRIVLTKETLTSKVVYKGFELPILFMELVNYLKEKDALHKVKIPFHLFFNISFPVHNDKTRCYLKYKELMMLIENEIKGNKLYDEQDIYLCDALLYSSSFFEFCRYYFPDRQVAKKQNVYVKFLGIIPFLKIKNNRFYLFYFIPLFTYKFKDKRI